MNTPAFPTDSHECNYQGMTLRDYFAAKAMQGILFECLELQDTAKFAYELADEMLKARQQ
jgi:hypothetical protein